MAKLPEQWRLVPLSDIVPTDGWHLDDLEGLHKLCASVKRYGQLRPVLVTEQAGVLSVVDGRRLLAAMRMAGLSEAVARVVVAEPAEVMLACELFSEMSCAKVARQVADLLSGGSTAEHLAGASPFTAERIAYMDTLTRFDWSQFAEQEGDGQETMDWGEEDVPPAVAVPAPPPVPDPAVPDAEAEPAAEAPAPAARPRKPKAVQAPSLWD